MIFSSTFILYYNKLLTSVRYNNYLQPHEVIKYELPHRKLPLQLP